MYSADPIALRQDIEAFLQNEPIPDLPSPDTLVVLKSPHIDYFRGYQCYGRAYQQIQGGKFDVVFLIGTSHQASHHLFHGTNKSFQTPLGIHQTDSGIVGRIAALYGERFFADEHLHDNEHSLELQLPFLSVSVGLVPIVPILVGGLHPLFGRAMPRQYEPYESFVASLITVLGELGDAGKKYCFVAGVDMAHIGAYFGDPGQVSETRLQEVQQKDMEYLNMIAQLDVQSLYLHAANDLDSRRICGHSTMVTVCDILQRRREKVSATLTGYQQCFTAENDCCVTIGAMGLYRS